MYNYPFLFFETLLVLSVYKSRVICYNIYVSESTEETKYGKY